MQEQLIALLGHPISHSKSPQMQNAAFNKLNLPYRYIAFDVGPDQLSDAVIGLKTLGFRGANVTIPHKVSIIPLLDDLTPLAKSIGAVNTLYYQNGLLIGDNTDGQGYLTSLILEFPSIDPTLMTIGIIGAGGAARAIAFTLAEHGVKKLYITNRNIEKGMELSRELEEVANVEFVSFEQMQKVINKIDLLIQTTPVGMSPNIDEILIPTTWLDPNKIVSDLIYNPIETRLLKEARTRGASTHNGLGMLVYQGALSFERWTGMKAPVEVMKEQLIKSLELK